MRGMAEAIADLPVQMTDGIRAEVDGGWVLVLPHPDRAARDLFVEGDDERSADALLEEYATLVEGLVAAERGLATPPEHRVRRAARSPRPWPAACYTRHDDGQRPQDHMADRLRHTAHRGERRPGPTRPTLHAPRAPPRAAWRAGAPMTTGGRRAMSDGARLRRRARRGASSGRGRGATRGRSSTSACRPRRPLGRASARSRAVAVVAWRSCSSRPSTRSSTSWGADPSRRDRRRHRRRRHDARPRRARCSAGRSSRALDAAGHRHATRHGAGRSRPPSIGARFDAATARRRGMGVGRTGARGRRRRRRARRAWFGARRCRWPPTRRPEPARHARSGQSPSACTSRRATPASSIDGRDGHPHGRRGRTRRAHGRRSSRTCSRRSSRRNATSSRMTASLPPRVADADADQAYADAHADARPATSTRHLRGRSRGRSAPSGSRGWVVVPPGAVRRGSTASPRRARPGGVAGADLVRRADRRAGRPLVLRRLRRPRGAVVHAPRPLVGGLGQPAKDARFKVSGKTVTHRAAPGRAPAWTCARSRATLTTSRCNGHGRRGRRDARSTRRSPSCTTEQGARRWASRERISTYTTDYDPGNAPRVNNIHTLAQRARRQARAARAATFSLQRRRSASAPPRRATRRPTRSSTASSSRSSAAASARSATTFFNAVFFSGLPVVERTNHSFYITHYPKGRDARCRGAGPTSSSRTTRSHWILVKTDYATASVTIACTAPTRATRSSYTTGPVHATSTPYPTVRSKDPTLPLGTQRRGGRRRGRPAAWSWYAR